MKHRVLSYSFVGVWARPALEIPMLDKRFCMDLFGDPYKTNSGLSNEGFLITFQDGSNPAPTALINPQRLQVTSQNLNTTIDVAIKVGKEIAKASKGRFSLELRSFGLNTEHEILRLEGSTENWLTKKFLAKGLKIDKKNKELVVHTKKLAFDIIHEQGNKKTISVEPRVNEPGGVFVYVNDHNEIPMDHLPTKKELESLFQGSIDTIKNDVLPLIGIEL